MAKKGNREIVTIGIASGTGYFYVTVKNKKVTKDKLVAHQLRSQSKKARSV